MASKRSRTGCLTCRQRKLKCSEERPVCAQCVKANRACIPSSGITFRHQQNPSMNGENGSDGSLKSFYGYKETFGQGVQWVSIPSTLTFVHTSNPYADEDAEYAPDATLQPPQPVEQRQEEQSFSLGHATYPAYATHGLEALSAVASDQYSYAPPPPPPMSSTETQLSVLLPTTTSPQSQAIASQNLDFILNPTSGLSASDSNIDPRLHSQTPNFSALQSPSHDSTDDAKLSLPT